MVRERSLTAAEAKAHQDRLEANGFRLEWWFDTKCRKCCGVYPAIRGYQGTGGKQRLECDVCGRRTKEYTEYNWKELAEAEWNSMDWLSIGEQMRLEL